METVFDLAAVVVVLAAALGYLNYKLLKLPQTIGLVVIAMVISLVLLAIDLVAPGLGVGNVVRNFVHSIDFSDTLMKGLLSFLLFAGALHADLSSLMRRGGAILAIAFLGTVISTFVIGGAVWLAAQALDLGLGPIHCLIFGALIAPTDPVAVLGILKRVHVPPTLEAKIAGESLFNDGVAIVMFSVLAGLAASGESPDALDPGGIAIFFIVEAIGGAALGLVTGFAAFHLLKSVDEHNLEVLITLALVMGTFALSDTLHVSGPIAMVCAGLLIGNLGTRFAMSETTREHTTSFWSLIDEILNSVLFLIIGFEVVAISGTLGYVELGLLAIPIVLVARFISVSLPIQILKGLGGTFTPGAIRILTWGGLRGGISVALVLSLPESHQREILLTACYFVVVFSIVVQGLTMETFVRRVLHTKG